MQKVNNAKPHYKARKTRKKHTTRQKNNPKPHHKAKKTMKNHTEMQNHATMKTKDGTKSS